MARICFKSKQVKYNFTHYYMLEGNPALGLGVFLEPVPAVLG